MRPFGVTKTDSVGDFGGQARQDYDHDRYGGDDAHRAASAGGTGAEVGSVVVVEEEKEGGGGGGGYYGKGTEVSSGCLGNLSPTAIVYMSAFVSSLTSVLLGYDAGVISGAIKYIVDDFGLSSLQKGVIVSSLNLVAAGGGLIAGTVSDTLGRKMSIAAACMVFITGSILKIVAQSFGVLLLGRIITGVGVGCGFVVAPVYIAEITPPHVRGRLTAFTGSKWRTMLGISIVPPFIILSSLFLLPESPRWLLGKGREREAFAVLCRIVTTEELVKKELDEIKSVEGGGVDGKAATWGELLFSDSPALRRTLFLGLGLGIAQQASGSEAVVYYSPSVLDDAGLTSDSAQLGGNILVGLFKLGGEVFAYFLVDRTGRRPLFLASSSLVTVFLVILAFSFSSDAPSWVTLSGLCMYMWCFSLGMGALTFLVAAEIFPLRYRGRGVSLAVCVNRLTSGLVALAFPLLEDGFTAGGTFFLFTIFSLCTVWFYQMKVPETMDRTLEEISAEASHGAHGVDTATALGLAPVAAPGTSDAL
eukprot:jgi/Undpi1/8573/HiC_scaffold_25.g11038.m1